MGLGAEPSEQARPSRFERFVLPGLAFKAVVIGGGYATGRELAEYFIPSGAWGGIASMLLAMVIWSTVCIVTFLFARQTRALNYSAFFKQLLGRFAFLFELSYFAYVIVVLAVFGAAAGSLGLAIFGWPLLYGTLCLIAGIAVFTAFGSAAVESLFKWVSILLYATYAVFFVLALQRFGDRIPASFVTAQWNSGWAIRGVIYSGYNILGAVVILPVVRHFTSDQDAIRAGALCGPLAMLPALVFFVCMCAFYPEIGAANLPSDFMLRQMNLPVFQLVFQSMIFAALLESGTGAVHAVNERIAASFLERTGRDISRKLRLVLAASLLIGSIFLASRFGLVTLISSGYRLLACLILVLYVLPLMTIGLWRVASRYRKRTVERSSAVSAEMPR
jgi:uncharacterized membrane protein YkvI